MLDYIRLNYKFITLTLLWVVFGVYIPQLAYAMVSVTFVLYLRWANYEYLVIGFLGLLFFSDSFYFPFAKEIKPVVLLVIGLYYFVKSNIFTPITKIYAPFLLLFVYALFLLVVSETPFLSFQKLSSYAFLYIALPSIFLQAYRVNNVQFFRNLIYFIDLLLIAGVVWFFVDSEVVLSHKGRFRGIMGNPNDLGMFCVVTFILYFIINEFFPLLNSLFDRLLTYGLLSVSLFWSGSRTALMCILIFLLFRKTQKASPLLTILAFVLILLLYSIITDNIVAITHALGLESYLRVDTLKEGSGRIHAWRYAWRHINQNFFFGKGWDYNQYLFARPEAKALLRPLNHEGDVHNVYLGFWLDLGLVGLILFFSALLYVFNLASRKTHLAYPALFSLLFMGMYEPWLIASMNPFTIMMLFSLTLMIYCRPNPIEEENQLVAA